MSSASLILEGASLGEASNQGFTPIGSLCISYTKKIRDAGFTLLRERFSTLKGTVAASENIHPDLKDEYDQELNAPTSSMLLSE